MSSLRVIAEKEATLFRWLAREPGGPEASQAQQHSARVAVLMLLGVALGLLALSKDLFTGAAALAFWLSATATIIVIMAVLSVLGARAYITSARR